MGKSDIAIVGISIYCPGAESVEDFWRNLANGVDSITEVPNEIIDHCYFQEEKGAIDRFYCNRGGFAKPFRVDPLRYGILPIAVDGMDPEHLIALAGVEQALYDAEVLQKEIPLQKGCIIIGKGNFSGLIPLRSLEIIRTATQITEMIKTVLPEIPDHEIDKIKKSYQAQQGRYQADTAIGTMPNLVASLVANKFDMQGPAYTIDAACASGIVAVEHCMRLLQSGQCDIAVAGGMHAGHSPMFWGAFNMMGALSHKGQISPFSEDADGLLIGQGGGMLVLKTLDKAIQDEDRIYAVIKGTAVCSDGGGSHVMVTSVDGQKRVLDMAWKNAGMDPKKIGYVEAHGTATMIGDRTEVATLKDFFGDNSYPEALLGSVKSNIGHTMPAAGMIGLIKTALSLYHRQIPPTLHCENPLKSMLDSRFRPAQQLVDWDGSKYPLIAGVNAFGFGGINSHAILTAYEKEVKPETKKVIPQEESIALSASSKDHLLKKLAIRDFTLSGGDYRLVIFNPTDERVEIAKTVVEKDKPWKGNMDIWFTNTPLLSAGGKVVFLFPGFDFDMESETDSVSDYFDLPRFEYESENVFTEQSVKQFYNSLFSDIAFKKLGVTPDAYSGYSIGEWYAARSAGLVSDESILKMMNSLDFNGETIEDLHYIAVGCSHDKLEPLYKDIPDLCLANDNCPSQVLLCGTGKAKEAIIEVLKSKDIFYHVLPFQSGFHTPFIADRIYLVDDHFEHIELLESDTPVWSATTLEVYPKDKEGFKKTIVEHLIKPVRFREMIEKLYNEEDARVFIQVGVGGLIWYIDDILKGKPYSAIASSVPKRLGVEQLRRVLATLFIEGRDVDYTFMGVRIQYQISKNLVTLPIGTPFTTDFTVLKEAINKYCTRTHLPQSSAGEIKHPVLQVMNENINAMNERVREMLSVQNEMATIFKENGYLDNANIDTALLESVKEKNGKLPLTKAAPAPVKRKGTKFEEIYRATLDEHPYLIDHAVIRQPKDWKYREDLNPVIPFTMTLELFAEIVKRQVPTKKILKIGPAMVMRWMSVETPFEQKVVGTWKTENTVSLEMKGYAMMDITVGDEYPEPPVEYMAPVDLGEKIMEPLPVKESFEKYAFHGPAYQSSVAMERITKKGIHGYGKKVEGYGSMLDNMGQSVGLFLHLTETENTISFPVRVKEINFYQDIQDQEGIFDQTLIIKNIKPNFVIGDMVVKRDGKLWATTKGWYNQRFEFDQMIWNVILKPTKNLIAKSLAPNVYYYENAYEKVASWQFLYKRYLSYPEKQLYDESQMEQLREYLISRIALKDAVRAFHAKEGEDYCYPIEIFTRYNTNGKPYVYGPEGIDKIEISLAHKKTEAVAIASNKPVGIDIEEIAIRSDEFMKHSFTQHELKLMEGKDIAEWNTRFWVAKEAFSKMTGEGLKGRPNKYEVEKIEGENLFVRGVEIHTMKHKDNYIVGWTV